MAQLENCPTCGNPTSENAGQCPACGEPLSLGWADEVREQKRLKAEAEKRAEMEAATALRNSKRRKRRIWAAIAIVLFAIIVGPGIYDSYRMESLKKSDPEEYQRIMEERERVAEQKRQEKIERLQAEVAKVPASDFDENLRLYKELQRLDPDNERFTTKISYYEAKRKEAAEAAAAAKAQKAAAAAAAEAQKKAEEKRKGFHCLSGWDGSHRGVKKYVEERMRDPDSFEHIETRITPVNADGEHTLIMKYRARNGFGGMTVGAAMATIRNSDCAATITAVE